jgi:DNA-binding GntR family transcriptional regulator
MQGLKQIDRGEQLADKAYRAIREFIINENAVNELRLTESILSEKLGISKTPIKEALGRLERQGIIKIVPRQGVYIPLFSMKDVIEVYDLRVGFEVLAIKLGQQNFDNIFLLKIKKLAKDMITDVSNKNYMAYMKSDVKFHKLLVETSKNNRLINFYSTLQYQMIMIRKQVLSIPGRPESYYLDHEKMYENIKTGDINKAIEILSDHINTAKKDLQSMFSENL